MCENVIVYEKIFFLKMMNCIDITNKGMSDTYFFSDEIQNEQKIQKAIRKILNYKDYKNKISWTKKKTKCKGYWDQQNNHPVCSKTNETI